jgi:hypothetical protein
MSAADQTLLWSEDEHTCLMISCCSGAELQLLRDGSLVLRELYPDKSTLYERARELRASLAETTGLTPDSPRRPAE